VSCEDFGFAVDERGAGRSPSFNRDIERLSYSEGKINQSQAAIAFHFSFSETKSASRMKR
jgi:hypothetical protein